MKVVIAPDSFKGSLSAKEAGLAIERGVKRACADCVTKVIPMADGGEGTTECLVDATGGRYAKAVVKDPLGRDIRAEYGILGDGATCVIEMASSSGLYLIPEEARDPLRATTFGFGQLIRAALDQGCRSFLLGLGGSATNDGGAGMLQALGVRLLDAEGRSVGFGGGELDKVAAVDASGMDPRIGESRFLIACDVDNPFVGPNGASAVFGPQKGATPEMVKRLDGNLRRFADKIAEARGIAVHDVPGTGAAGGLSGSLLAFMDGRLESGVSIVARLLNLEGEIRGADLVFTGEGRIDHQTARGKTPCGVAQAARKHGAPVVALAGSVGEGIEGLHELGITAVASIVNRPMSLEQAMARTGPLLEQAAEQVVRIFRAT